ncbi:MAG: DUF58 domain-containing protein [Candidatus Baltobacteraceae bacterium]
MRLPLWFSARFYWALGAIAILSAASPGVALFEPLAVAAAVLLALGVGIDLARGPRAADVVVVRRIPEHIALRRAVIITHDVFNRSRAAIRFEAVEAPLRTLEFENGVTPTHIPAERRVSIERTAMPVARGSDRFSTIYVTYENSLGLIRRYARIDAAQPFRVYPDLSAVERYGALHIRNRLIDAGVRRMRLRGPGSEFESLREYAEGDAFRAIDWKATARRGKMMVMQHEVERSGDVMLLLDCGRLMTARVGAQRKLDYAITAALSVASIASLAHDRVGIAAFAGDMLVARAPRSTAASIRDLTRAIYDLEPRFEESDYARAAAYLRSHLRRRSLIVLFTDAIDPVAQSTVLAELGSLAKRHRILCVFMNDAAVAGTLARTPADVDDAYRLSVAIELARERSLGARILARAGIDVIDVPAAKLAVATIDEYLKIKSQGGRRHFTTIG